MASAKDAAVYVVLKALLALFYVISHVYDYLSYPIYLVAYHPWRVRRYKRMPHARREDREGEVIFHSVQVGSQQREPSLYTRLY